MLKSAPTNPNVEVGKEEIEEAEAAGPPDEANPPLALLDFDHLDVAVLDDELHVERACDLETFGHLLGDHLDPGQGEG